MFKPKENKNFRSLYKKLKNYQFEKGDKSGFDPMQQLQNAFSDEEIIWLLNNMSKTEDNKQELNVAQEGGSPDPKTNFYRSDIIVL